MVVCLVYTILLCPTVFPAGILQPPFYHKYFPKSLNFGGIGVVIGHEIMHGFDNRGHQFDHQGNINNWLDPESSMNFHQRALCIVSKCILKGIIKGFDFMYVLRYKQSQKHSYLSSRIWVLCNRTKKPGRMCFLFLRAIWKLRGGRSGIVLEWFEHSGRKHC